MALKSYKSKFYESNNKEFKAISSNVNHILNEEADLELAGRIIGDAIVSGAKGFKQNMENIITGIQISVNKEKSWR